MSLSDFVRRTLQHFAQSNLAVIAGVVAATATITGALIVGDSVRGSLRDMTLARLGSIQNVMTGPRFVTEDLVADLGADCVPAILLTGTCKGNDRVAGSVQVVAVPEDATTLLWPNSAFSLSDRDIVVNARVAEALAVGAGDAVSLLVELPASVPRDSLLGERDEVLTEVRFNVAEVLAEESGAGRFSLSPAQQLPSVVFVSLTTLQQSLDIDAIAATRRTAGRIGRVNTVFTTTSASRSAADLNTELSAHLRLEDIDARLIETPSESVISVESRSQIVPNAVRDAAHEAAAELKARTKDVFVYLINEMANAEDAEKFSTYSVIAGLSSFDGFRFEGPTPTAELSESETVINRWLADDLGVEVGDTIRIEYLEVGDTGDLPELEATFTVAGILAMEGPALDRTLSPTVPGITDAKTFADWDQPYPMNLSRVTDRDEDYWDAYRATPKMYLSLPAMQARFESRYGNVTSIRVDGSSPQQLEKKLVAAIDPTALGASFVDIRKMQLMAASGTTDFSGLFFGFSLFLIASALLLIGLLFRLGIESRVRQLGLLRAVGWTPTRIRRVVLSEGLSLAGLGALLGLAAAVAYAAAMLHGLTTWWGGATGTQFLTLHVTPVALAVGFVVAVAVSLLTMWMAVRKLNRLEPIELMSGQTSDDAAAAMVQPRSRWTERGCLGVGGVLLVALLLGLVPNVEAFAGFSWRIVGFFVVGSLMLVGGLALFASRLGTTESARQFGLSRLGWQNLGRSRGRSLLTASLIACATFLLVAVGVAREDPTAEEPEISSGNGGYRLVAESATPILTDITTEAGRFDAQFLEDEADPAFEGVQIASLRLRPGDDASCLNLYAARLPTLIGVPEGTLREWDAEGRFAFADTPSDSRWAALASDSRGEDGAVSIPVLGDMNTLLYSLHKAVGQSIDVPTEVHPNATLEVRGMLSGSVFQGALLMSDENLRRLDPGVVGYRYFLVETSGDKESDITTLLESGLADYGFDAEPVGTRIANFLAVQNTYLATFQALGGLGLLLGTLGLGTVMLRNVVERVRELAVMRAVGFGSSRLTQLVLGENAILLLVGLLVGTVTALLAMSPHILSAGADVPWSELGLLLAGVFLIGMLAAVAAVRRATSVHMIEALKSE